MLGEAVVVGRRGRSKRGHKLQRDHDDDDPVHDAQRRARQLPPQAAEQFGGGAEHVVETAQPGERGQQQDVRDRPPPQVAEQAQPEDQQREQYMAHHERRKPALRVVVGRQTHEPEDAGAQHEGGQNDGQVDYDAKQSVTVSNA